MANSDELRDLVKGQLIRIQISNAAVFKADCSAILETDLREFVRGAEGASADAGILVGARVTSFRGSDDRLAKVIQAGEAGEPDNVVAVDFKTIIPVVSTFGKDGGCYHYKISCTRVQKQKCAALIVFNPASPHLVAVIPMFYLETSNRYLDRRADSTPFTARKIPYFGGFIELFPLECTPFIMPIAFASRSLDLLRQFAAGEISTWYARWDPWGAIVAIY
ncbi:hypothetical protein G647_10424 [Cladophialophora carrionii CBS 160.54]|uniref:Uncharacterized protein n=1 Tax=Cladophialophora carrionii CBS 160.54 TaxID=1279043 RepID=V9DIB5_9EURO|nr:uncharacterized protein G647_10424 [Cladophialophora carrionii CBS 160.54]ETI26610.1 hypothetical protein G647_10424 [Cladophialophora carrionii CBS 160.54]